MCDEYDDERMRILWRQLAIQEGRTELEEDPKSLREPLVRPAEGIVAPQSRKPRTLVR